MAQSISSSSSKSVPLGFLSRHNLSLIFRTLGVLLLLLAALPFNLLLTAISLIWSQLKPAQPTVAAQPKTILISGGKMTKALQLARSFHAAGHRVILAETQKYWLSGHRFSRAVSRFYSLPVPQQNAEIYAQALLKIVQQEQVDLYLPVCSPAASYYDALVKSKLEPHCEVMHTEADQVQLLDDKYSFNQTALALGLSVPKSYHITDPAQVMAFDFSQETRPYILKSIPYSSVYRLNLTRLPCADRTDMEAFVYSLPISLETPWIMQEFIAGQEFCTHSTVRNGEIRLHCCCESSAFQVNYEQIEHPAILDWVTRFVKALNLTGQVSFDFMQAEDGAIYAIECNPRTHSAITMFYNHPGVATAYLDSAPLPAPMQPQSKPTYWLYHELWRLTSLRSGADLWRRLKILWYGKDAIYSLHDPLPFLMVHHWQIPLLLLQNLRQMKGWMRIDFNIGKLIELGGD